MEQTETANDPLTPQKSDELKEIKIQVRVITEPLLVYKANPPPLNPSSDTYPFSKSLYT
jgi:hypothetical protein